MLDDLRELYQEVVLDHGKSPRNFRDVENATAHAHGANPLCGDQLVVYLKVDTEKRIEDVSFVGNGCAISVASASMMTEVLRGRTEVEARQLFDDFHRLCTETDFTLDQAATEDQEALERLQVLSGVRAFPVRVKCATLAWHAMTSALDGGGSATTE